MASEKTSRISGFYKMPIDERIRIIAEQTGLSSEDVKLIKTGGGLSFDAADHMIENVIGTIAYPFSVAVNFIWAVSANTPKNIQKILEKALLQAIADPGVKKRITSLEKIYDPLDSDALTKEMFDDHQKFGALMKKFGLGIYKK